ncbi:MAG: Asp-tRNA(Asn)/Glu-tRNA(Gln) amidotransferase GatCAB subunit B, partial [Eubacterium sp.]|nr:Asp-tRNA(Asn)/Glu-tRNA(Gln) amidotransferase GatCAB subunit B [Eubacterium sp.]
NGMTVERETRRWDDDSECSYVMRSKEETNDYRYFPEPDLMPFAISDELVKEIREKMPELPEAKKKRYSEEYKLPEKDIEILMGEPALVRIFEKTIYAADDTVSDFPKKVSNWLLGDTMRIAGERGLDTEDIRIDPVSLLQLIKLRSDNKINQTTAKKILEIIFDAGEYVDVDAYVTEHGLAVVNDTSIVNELADRVIRENPKAAEDYRNGKEKAVGFLVGQIMKHSKGQADPELARQAVIQRILTE